MPPRPEPAEGVDAGPHVNPAGGRCLDIAFVYDALYPCQNGGAERRYFELAHRLKERHNVHYFTWTHWEGPAVVEREGITFHGLGRPPHMYGGDGKRTIREALAFAAALGPALSRNRFDVVDCSATPYLPLYSCWAATRVSRSPVVATWHEFWGPHWHSYLPHRRAVAATARGLEAGCVPLADRLVAVSPFTAQRMPRGRHAAVVPNGISLEAFQRAPHPPAHEAADVLFVGRLIDDKRVDVLLNAMTEVRERLPSVHCAIIGEGPERPHLENLVCALGLRDNVRFLGRVSDEALAGHLRAARVFVLPSIREGFGIAVVEAMAAGAVPVVAQAPHSAAGDLVEEGVTGHVRPPSPRAFADAITSLLSDPERLATMSAAAVSAAAAYDWDAITGRMETIYAETASRGLRLLQARRKGREPALAGGGQRP